MYVILEEVNDYDQYGAYFVALYTTRPSSEQLEQIFKNANLVEHLLKTGGGRIENEDTWYYLIEIEEGRQLDHNNLSSYIVTKNESIAKV